MARGFDVAVCCVKGSCDTGVVDCAAVAGVEGHLVLGLFVYAFDYVDFAVVGPVGAEHPAVCVSFFFLCFGERERGIEGLGLLQGGPAAACTARHVGQIENNKSMLVGGGTLQANALATRLGGDVGVVDADVDAVARVDETVARGSVTIDVVHKAIGGIGVLYIG